MLTRSAGGCSSSTASSIAVRVAKSSATREESSSPSPMSPTALSSSDASESAEPGRPEPSCPRRADAGRCGKRWPGPCSPRTASCSGLREGARRSSAAHSSNRSSTAPLGHSSVSYDDAQDDASSGSDVNVSESPLRSPTSCRMASYAKRSAGTSLTEVRVAPGWSAGPARAAAIPSGSTVSTDTRRHVMPSRPVEAAAAISSVTRGSPRPPSPAPPAAAGPPPRPRRPGAPLGRRPRPARMQG